MTFGISISQWTSNKANPLWRLPKPCPPGRDSLLYRVVFATSGLRLIRSLKSYTLGHINKAVHGNHGPTSAHFHILSVFWHFLFFYEIKRLPKYILISHPYTNAINGNTGPCVGNSTFDASLLQHAKLLDNIYHFCHQYPGLISNHICQTFRILFHFSADFFRE